MGIDVGLVTFSCGCIGFPPVAEKPIVVVYDCCQDAHSDEYRVSISTPGRETALRGKTYEPCPPDLQESIMLQLGALVRQGYALRRIKSALERE